MTPNGSNDPSKLNKNQLAGLLVLLVIVIIAAQTGYRFHIGITGFTFEKDAAQITAR